METLSVCDLKKEEVPNCVICFERKITGDQRLSSLVVAGGNSGPSLGFVMVGTAFLNLDETFPTSGRILIYEVEIKGQLKRLNLRHIENVKGAVNAFAIVGRDQKHLAVGVNNEL